MYMFTVEQTVPGAGKRAGRERVATLDAAVLDVEAATRLNAILAEVKQRYLDLYVARATSRLLAEQVPLLENTIDASTLRYAAGHAGQRDTVGSIVELARLRADAVDWLERERLVETRLNALLGRDPAAPVPALADPGIEAPPPADAEALAVAHNAEVAVAEKMVQREEAELARVRGDRRPDLIVGGGYMLQPGSAGAWTLKAGLTWPNAPWSRGKLATDIAAQQQRVAAATATRAAAVLAARSAARQALVRLAAAHERVRLLESTVLPHVEHGLEVARAAYVSEGGDYADLIDTQRVLVSTRITLIAARADIARAAADLTLAMGLDQEE
jgi:outer membrane protein TolC